jgi:hypothetical protein
MDSFRFNRKVVPGEKFHAKRCGMGAEVLEAKKAWNFARTG